MDTIESCSTCKHAGDLADLNKSPDTCWDCISKTRRVHWEQKLPEKNEMGSGADDMDTPMEYDIINKPKHYTTTKLQPIDVIEAWDLEYHLGNVVKYIARAPYKGNQVQDLEKARWYLDRFISIKKGQQ